MSDDEKVTKLPLWRTCVEKMIEDGLFYSKTYSIEWFEGRLKVARSTPRFNFAIYRIRIEIEKLGFYLNGIGISKTGFYTLQQAEANIDTVMRHNTRSRRLLRRSVRLAMMTEREMLTASQCTKMDQIMERQQIRLAFMRRTAGTVKALGGKQAAAVKKLTTGSK